ncbi:TonB-dependent receptor [Paraflavisolibacter sp. H34]|uniref:SusC/RagA family TonB-linked outer membrane protein n=1 Tax=Huijunlia imazamoxiresistens TaxID=3127457 RepID=UPI00301ADE40
MRKLAMMLAVSLFATGVWAQEQKITGTIINKNTGEPIPGVTIKGAKASALSAPDGSFTIAVKQGETLTFSYVGFAAHSLKAAAGLSALKVELEVKPNSLDAVVVTGYTRERKKDMTGAVAVVDVDDMRKQATANPIKGLQGQVAGMVVTSNGAPGGPATVRIRGVGTLNNNDPLLIIDGVPSKGGMHELNPADIETMQVLKDASSASIYGSRAANGVIVITTKRGKAGRLSVKANAYTSVSDYASKMEVLNAGGYGQALWQAAVNSGRDPNSNNVAYRFDWDVDANGTPVLKKIILPEYLDGGKTLKTADTDWFREVARKGVIQNYDLNVSNGNEKGSYLLSLGYFDNKGIVKTTDFKRLSLRLNSDYKLLNNRLTIGQNLSVNRTREVVMADGGTLNLALQVLPVIPVRTADGKGWGGPWGGMNDRQNPVRLLEDNKQNHYNFIRAFGNVYADLQLVKGLNFRTNYGLDFGDYYKRNLRKKYQSGYLQNDVNRLDIGESRSVKQNWSNTLNYVLNRGRHRADLLAGTEYFNQFETNFWASREGFDIEDPAYTYMDAGTSKKDNGGGANEYSLFSYFGKANYSYDGRYLASVTLRRDGSSRFGRNNRFGTFPAFSLGWRLSEEAFVKNSAVSRVLSDLKLRYGWGKTGNQEIDNNAIYSIYLTDYAGGDPTWNISRGTAYDITGAGTGSLPSGYRKIQNGNDNLRWEASAMHNWGLDFGLWNNHLTGSAEYFIKTTDDILISPPYLAVLGEGGAQFVNGASMENRGFEFATTYNGKLGKDLSFSATANISTYRNKITRLPDAVINSYGGNGKEDNILGRPLGSFYGYIADGLFRSQKEVDDHAVQTGKGVGRLRYRDLDGNGEVDNGEHDRTWIGSPHPDFTYGLNLGVEYKNFDVSVLLQGVQGIDVVNEQKYATDFWSIQETGSNKGLRLLNAYHPVTNPASTIPMLAYSDENRESRFSTYFVENGSYLKLRNAQLGYTFSKSLLQKVKIQNLRAYIGGDNLLLLMKSKSFTGADPESPAYGYPNPRVFTAGINLSL